MTFYNFCKLKSDIGQKYLKEICLLILYILNYKFLFFIYENFTFIKEISFFKINTIKCTITYKQNCLYISQYGEVSRVDKLISDLISIAIRV